ncbi:MAG: bifunctional phosphoserine phosphatase/homoserine phosphotransferase ThrH [Acidiferrobacter sp.]|nr:bifunctional phosphoserine phosphatase/homoserine phosphotransferase ThrH [Acidiferrobacter sp.]|tara:strand:- start:1175 stop:1798 length:624 start_codon:yes stop_codon:yes gene_type:complete
MLAICLDLEGVLIPEIWISVAERTGIKSLRRTTRDEPDYDLLMSYRIGILDEHDIKIEDITSTIGSMDPMEGANEFLQSLESRWPTLILSDTFSQFAKPMMAKLGHPTLLCHTLAIDDSGRIADWEIRCEDHKRKTVEALVKMNYKVIAAGDSYNDTSMLSSADAGILFRPPENVIEEFPQFPIARDYEELTAAIEDAASDLGELWK